MLVVDGGGVGMDEYNLASLWTLGFCSMKAPLYDSEGVEYKQPRSIKSDWETHRMPRTRAHFDLGIEISEEDFETLAWGHIPTAMEDHWFMYFDGEAFCFHRSWTGFCLFRVYVKRSSSPDNRGGYVLYRVTANRSKKQYEEESDERDAILVCILIGQALEKDVSGLWDQYFELGKEGGVSG